MPELLVDDVCMRALEPRLRELAAYLIASVDDGKYFAIRYHNDCDGICAGLCVYKALNAVAEGVSISYFPSQSAIYSLRDAQHDLNELNDARETVMVIVDHGANLESIEALGFLKAAGVEIVIIDHHPYDRRATKMPKFFINPIAAGGTSSHTAGLLCYELARIMDPECVDGKIVQFSLQGDKSEFASKAHEYKEPMAIDYIANREELGLPFYEKMLESREMVDEAYQQARERIDAALKAAERVTAVMDFGPYAIIISRISRIVRKGEFPTRGKVMNEIIARKGRDLGKPLIALGILDDSISFRANAPVLELGFDANKIIQQLRKTFGSEIYEGGGHSAAASLRANSDVMPLLEKEILSLIRAQVRG